VSYINNGLALHCNFAKLPEQIIWKMQIKHSFLNKNAQNSKDYILVRIKNNFPESREIVRIGDAQNGDTVTMLVASGHHIAS
jgi:hypothetical protein